jgi:hypothetical protein
MAPEHENSRGEGDFLLSPEDEILGIGMTLCGAGRPGSPLQNWRDTLSAEDREEALGIFRTLFQIRQGS